MDILQDINQALSHKVAQMANKKRWTLHFETSSGLRCKLSRDSLTHLMNCMEDDDRIVTITKNFVNSN